MWLTLHFCWPALLQDRYVVEVNERLRKVTFCRAKQILNKLFWRYIIWKNMQIFFYNAKKILQQPLQLTYPVSQCKLELGKGKSASHGEIRLSLTVPQSSSQVQVVLVCFSVTLDFCISFSVCFFHFLLTFSTQYLNIIILKIWIR